MFREKEICDAIRTAYLHLFPDKKERKRALSRLDLELVAQGVRYESMMTRRPEGGKAASRPPSLSPGHPCYGCGTYRPGQPCVGFCHKELTAWLRERRKQK